MMRCPRSNDAVNREGCRNTSPFAVESQRSLECAAAQRWKASHVERASRRNAKLAENKTAPLLTDCGGANVTAEGVVEQRRAGFWPGGPTQQPFTETLDRPERRSGMVLDHI